VRRKRCEKARRLEAERHIKALLPFSDDHNAAREIRTAARAFLASAEEK
jgi:hypothetical protein